MDENYPEESQVIGELMGKVERLRDILSNRATGGQSYNDDDEYRKLRATLRTNETVAPLLPGWLKQIRTLDEWWGHIKPLFGSYAERRAYLSTEFDPVLTYLEETYPGVAPIPPALPKPPPRPSPVTGGTTEGPFDAFFANWDRAVQAQQPVSTNLSPAPAVTPKATPAPKAEPVRVFVVHGHDHGPRDSVARLIERLGFEPVILEEQPNQGRTIIEKFEAYADVRFAVVVLTPDDMGGTKGGPPVRPRARQNVILELGFFIGTLGRDHVAAIVVGNVETPSDVDGVLYIPFDPATGSWRSKLAREMKAAGLPVDLNRLG